MNIYRCRGGINIHYLYKKRQNILGLVIRRLEELLMNMRMKALCYGMGIDLELNDSYLSDMLMKN